MIPIEDILAEPDNVAKLLGADTLKKIGMEVYRGYKTDMESRSSWEERNKVAINLAMLTMDRKLYNGEQVSNVKYPIITDAAIQFSARVYPNIIKADEGVVKAKIIGDDKQGVKAERAENVRRHMSFQLLEESDDWEEGMDKMFIVLPIVGCTFKKTYRDENRGRNVSEFIMPDDIVVYYYAKSLYNAPRITHRIYKYPNDIISYQRQELWLDHSYGQAQISTGEKKSMSTDEGGTIETDEDTPHEFLEQHCWLDLDEDNYKEPYVVTVHKDSRRVARIVPRYEKDDILKKNDKIYKINPIECFTKYDFIPAPDDSIYGMGWGHLLAPINTTVNTSLNQMLDGATSANRQGGFIARGVQLGRNRQAGNIRFKQGEWKVVNASGSDLKNSIVPIPANVAAMGPLFSLLELMIEMSRKTASLTDILAGESPGANVPASTTLSLVEQGLKVYTAVYKRIHKSLKLELKKWYKLNERYLDPADYRNVLDKPVTKEDYRSGDFDIIPISDPASASDMQKILKAEALMQKIQFYNPEEVRRRYLEALNVDDIDALMEMPPQQDDPKTAIEKGKLSLKEREHELKRDRFEYDLEMGRYEVMKLKSEAIKNIALAEAAEEGIQIDKYKAKAESLKPERNANGNQQGNVQPVAGGEPGNA